MNCTEVVILLEQYVDRELSGEEIAEVQRHLDACPPCLALYRFEASVRRLVRRACNESAPASLKERILSQRSAAS
jgi:mycothiol system anti-sigma-R factor